MGRDILRRVFSSLLCKITTLFPDIMKEEAAATRNSAMCYQTVKVSTLNPGLSLPFGHFSFMKG